MLAFLSLLAGTREASGRKADSSRESRKGAVGIGKAKGEERNNRDAVSDIRRFNGN
jgi:hypothetical protein